MNMIRVDYDNARRQAQKLQELGIKSKKGGKEIPKELLSKEESIY